MYLQAVHFNTVSCGIQSHCNWHALAFTSVQLIGLGVIKPNSNICVLRSEKDKHFILTNYGKAALLFLGTGILNKYLFMLRSWNVCWTISDFFLTKTLSREPYGSFGLSKKKKNRFLREFENVRKLYQYENIIKTKPP